jgi:hypothetical protein
VLCTVPIELPMRVPDVHLVWRRSRELSAPAAAFRDMVLAWRAAGGAAAPAEPKAPEVPKARRRPAAAARS